MAFTLIRSLLEIDRDLGNKQLFLAVYETDTKSRYIALSERQKQGDGWVSLKKGITVRRSEINAVIKALQTADFDGEEDTSGLTAQEYAERCLDWG